MSDDVNESQTFKQTLTKTVLSPSIEFVFTFKRGSLIIYSFSEINANILKMNLKVSTSTFVIVFFFSNRMSWGTKQKSHRFPYTFLTALDVTDLLLFSGAVDCYRCEKIQ